MTPKAQPFHKAVDKMASDGRLSPAEAVAWHYWLHAYYNVRTFERSATARPGMRRRGAIAVLSALRREIEPKTPLAQASRRAVR